ncbi:Aquaporin TIP2-3 [Hibiscus syriacus]|uniref:Aquaporin TIP2-3 n=1 Tax=Hibiscus syriacus TaxID=106335 RepID=A0A6A2ZBX8_HIBSY|nr:Aquaporin TIP2-3 [Hibiscus syriacus]
MTAYELGGNTLVGLFAVAVAHALVVGVMISAGHISGGHLNPTVTIGLLFGGHILYWIDQLLVTWHLRLLVYFSKHSSSYVSKCNGVPSRHNMGDYPESLTFALLFTVYATMVDPKKGSIDGLGPMLTGFVVGANILAGGAFSGASMNPARSFGFIGLDL